MCSILHHLDPVNLAFYHMIELLMCSTLDLLTMAWLSGYLLNGLSFFSPGCMFSSAWNVIYDTFPFFLPKASLGVIYMTLSGTIRNK